MSEEKPLGLTIVEKFFGLIVILIGALTINFTYNDPPGGVVAPFSGLFIAASIVLIAIGIFLVVAKTE